MTLAMKLLYILSISLAAAAVAEVPRSVPVTRYAGLWTDSPFTSKPPPAADVPEVNPLEDYALGGISPISGGYRVTLLNRKNPEERIILPDNPDFKILAVQYATGNPLGTTVRLSTGSKTGTVSFDEKLLTLKSAPAAAAQPPPQGQPHPAGIPGQPPVPTPTTGGDGQRAPRPRVVPPASAAGQNGAAAPPPGVTPQPQRPVQSQGQQRIPRRQ